MRACARCGTFIEREGLCEPCQSATDAEKTRGEEALRHRNNAFTGAFISVVAAATGAIGDARILLGCFAGLWLAGRELVEVLRPSTRDALGDRLTSTAIAAFVGFVTGLAGVAMLALWIALKPTP